LANLQVFRMAERPKGEDVKRVRSVVDEAIELVAANAQGLVEIQVGSDSFDVKHDILDLPREQFLVAADA
jgi:hypothetical protein